MYLQFKGKRLAGILGDLRSVIAPKTSIPALSNVLIESMTAGRVRFTATDLDHTLQIEADHEGLFTGKCCVALDRLLGLAKALPEDDLTLTPQGNGWVEAQSDTGKYRITGIPPEKYPETPHGEAQSYEVEAADLLLALSQVTHHAGRYDHDKFEVRGALLELNGCLRCVATNGKSFAVCEVSPAQPFLTGEVLVSWFLPQKAIAAVRKCFPAGKVLCWATENHIYMRQGGTLLISRRASRGFFSYGKVLELLPPSRLTLNPTELSRALDVALSFAKEVEGVTVPYKDASLAFDRSGLLIKTVSGDGEAVEETVAAEAGEDFEVKLDIGILRSALKVGGEGVSIFAAPGMGPWALVSEGDNAKTTQVILPLAR